MEKRNLKILQIINSKAEEGAPISALTDHRRDRTTTYRHVQQLVHERLVITKGSGRWMRYFLTPAGKNLIVSDYLDQPPHLRAACRYRKEVLDSYIPGKTRFLDKSLSQKLQKEATFSEKPSLRFLEAFLVDLSFASAQMEGSTLTWLQTTELIQYGDTSNKDHQSVELVLAHKAAIGFLLQEKPKLTPKNIKEIHYLVTHGVFRTDEPRGRLREKLVSIAGSTYAPLEIPTMIEESLEEFCYKAQKIKDPLEAALFTMLMLPYIQPFDDGNKRTSRIAMNIPLLAANLCPFSFTHLKVNVYHKAMVAFYELNTPTLAAECFLSGYSSGLVRHPELRARLEISK